MHRVVLASGNPGKLAEMRALLGALQMEVVPQSAFDVPAAEETGLSFVENAILKARNAARHTRLPALADDSGIEVDALDGAPGIYSARFAGPDAADADNNARLLEALTGLPEARRSARYQCIVVYMRHAADPVPLICQGSWEGRILAQAQGSGGFGYDPLFWVPELGCSAAQLPSEEKNRRSHRGQALRCLAEALRRGPA